MENIIFLELRRRYKEVYVGQMEKDGEVDFVVLNDGNPIYYQVALTVLDEVFGEANFEGIQKLNVLKWITTSL